MVNESDLLREYIDKQILGLQDLSDQIYRGHEDIEESKRIWDDGL